MFSLTRFYYEHLKVMFHMIIKRGFLVEVWCTLISLNFYLFQNNFASLRGPKLVLFRRKVSLVGPILAHCTTQRSIYLSYSALKTNEEESTLAFTQNHHGWLVISNGLPANDFLYMRSEIVRNVILTKFVCCADSDLLYISNLRLSWLPSRSATAFDGLSNLKPRSTVFPFRLA